MKKIKWVYIVLVIFLIMYYLWDQKFFLKKEIPFKETGINIIKFFTFSKDDSLKEWEEKIFKGRVNYKIFRNKESFVAGESAKTASALYYKIKMDVNDASQYPVISWEWNVRKFPKKSAPERLELKEQDDFAARVYVIFPAAFFLNSKVLEYVWAEYAKEGEIISSPYSKNIKLFVLRSGVNKKEGFIYEERNILEDYIKAFGNPPKLQIGAIAFMTDADSTNSEAVGEYTNIKLGYKSILKDK